MQLLSENDTDITLDIIKTNHEDTIRIILLSQFVVYGNLDSRSGKVTGSGKVKFREKGLAMKQIATKVLTAHVPLPLADKVDQLASRLERSRGWIMKQALSAWIDQEEERSRLTREALADVNSGDVIDHQAVQAWADSLNTDAPLPIPR